MSTSVPGELMPMSTAPRDGSVIVVRSNESAEREEYIAFFNRGYSIHGLGGHWAPAYGYGQAGDLHLAGWRHVMIPDLQKLIDERDSDA